MQEGYLPINLETLEIVINGVDLASESWNTSGSKDARQISLVEDVFILSSRMIEWALLQFTRAVLLAVPVVFMSLCYSISSTSVSTLSAYYKND